MNRKLILIAGILVAIAANPAVAAPTYLTCQLPGVELQITADEANGTVTVFNATTGKLDALRGAFRPTELLFATSLVSYRINRETLRIDRQVPGLKMNDSGRCEVQKAKPRAF